MATPVPPSTPAVGADEVLATLPSPWMMGAEKPKPMAERPTKAEVRPLARKSYVTMKGEVFDHQFIKWLKDNSNAWILLVDFDAGKLPEMKQLAAARLVLYVIEAHNEAPMQAAAVSLTAPFEAGKPYDFKGLGEIIGSTTVAKGAGPGAPFDPPRRYEIDVTREVRRWINGGKPLGMAVRIVPNRGIDDGWTVRFTPAKDKPAELEILTYEDK